MIPFYEQISKNILTFHSMGLICPPHLHPQLELVYVLENQLEMMINNQEWIFEKGDFIIIFPNTIHSYDRVNSQDPIHGLTQIAICDLMLAGEYMNRLINYQAKEAFIRREDLHGDVSFAMDSLFKEADKTQNLSVCRALIQLILARTLPQFDLIKNKDVDDYGLIYQLVNFISQNFREALSLDLIADELAVSKYYLSRIFSKKLNTNFNDYINGVRLNYATMLISTTDRSITQIWNDSGFNSQRTFNRVFLEGFHMSPREYRSKDKENMQKDLAK